jgi:N6-adenosine-specific RNA methylase IME4
MERERTRDARPSAPLTTAAPGAQKYDVIYIDPPWHYNGRWENDSLRGGARRHYPLMTDDELRAFGPTLDQWAAPDCAMPMWGTGARFDFAIELLSVWGWRYRTLLATWVKTYGDGAIVTRPGFYTSQTCELLLLAGRGSIPVAERLLPQVHFAPVGEHSEKPAIFRSLVECLWPDARRLEVFARTAAPGWHAWGNQVGLLDGGSKQIRAWRDDGQGRLFNV